VKNFCVHIFTATMLVSSLAKAAQNEVSECFGPLVLVGNRETTIVDPATKAEQLGKLSQLLNRTAGDTPDTELANLWRNLKLINAGNPNTRELTPEQKLTSESEKAGRSTLWAAYLITGWNSAIARATLKNRGAAVLEKASVFDDDVGSPSFINLSPHNGRGDLVAVVDPTVNQIGKALPEFPGMIWDAIPLIMVDPRTPPGVVSVMKDYLEGAGSDIESHPTALFDMALWIDINALEGKYVARGIRKIADDRDMLSTFDKQAQMHFEETPRDETYINPFDALGTIEINLDAAGKSDQQDVTSLLGFGGN